eukprot:1947695-Pleurochrysis_carterae.AAC.3
MERGDPEPEFKSIGMSKDAETFQLHRAAAIRERRLERDAAVCTDHADYADHNKRKREKPWLSAESDRLLYAFYRQRDIARTVHENAVNGPAGGSKSPSGTSKPDEQDCRPRKPKRRRLSDTSDEDSSSADAEMYRVARQKIRETKDDHVRKLPDANHLPERPMPEPAA